MNGARGISRRSRLKKRLPTHSGRRLRVVVRYTSDAWKRRSFSWRMDASGTDKQGKLVVFNGNLYHFNPVFNGASRKAAHAHGVEARNAAAQVTYKGRPPLRIVK